MEQVVTRVVAACNLRVGVFDQWTACAWEIPELKEALRGVFEPALKQVNKKLRENLGSMQSIFKVVQLLDYCQEDATRY